MKNIDRIYEIKELRNFQEIVDCCCTCENVSTPDNIIFRCEKHKMEVYRFSKCDDYED